MYDLIYCNGDSFCAGMDLAEERYFPDLTGYTWDEWQTNFTANTEKITAMKDRWVWWPEEHYNLAVDVKNKLGL